MFNFFRNIKVIELEARLVIAEAELKVVKQGLDRASAHNVSLVETNKRQHGMIEQLSGTIETKALTTIKFSCITPLGQLRESTFTLGPGRCGKTVESLDLIHTQESFKITQWHDDGSKKEFTYRIGDIVGRVQTCYEVVTVQPNTKYIERLREQAAWERRARMLGRR